MPKTKLTAALIQRATPKKSAFILWDSELPGLGVKVQSSGRKAYVLRFKIAGRERTKQLGLVQLKSLSDARLEGRQKLGIAASGIDPFEAPGVGGPQKRGGGGLTFGELAQRLIDEHTRPKRKASTAAEYQRKLDHDLPEWFTQLPAVEVSREHVQALHQSKAKQPVAANRIRAFVSAALTFAEVQGLRPPRSNPAVLVEKYPEKARERYLTPGELGRLGKALEEIQKEESSRSTACEAIRLLALTGARRNEVLELRWEYIDRGRGCAFLPDSKTGKKMLRLGAAGLELLGRLPDDSEWCFPSTRGDGPLRDLRKTLEAARTKANEDVPAKDKIQPFRIHDLRHSFASVAVGTGHSLPTTGKLLGHARASTTERYAHLAQDHIAAAHEAVQAEIARGLEGQGGE